MKFSLNIQGNNSSSTGIKSAKNEEQEMTTANNNIQMHSNNSGTLVIKNTLKMAAGLALAGMIAVTAAFGGSVAADSPSRSVSFSAHGPNEMDYDYLNKLGNTFMVHGPNAMDTKFLNNLGNNFFVHCPDVVAPSAANAFRIHGPDVVQRLHSSRSGLCRTQRLHHFHRLRPEPFRVDRIDLILIRAVHHVKRAAPIASGAALSFSVRDLECPLC